MENKRGYDLRIFSNEFKGEFFWPVFPIIFWGGGLAVHCIGVFGERRRLSREMEALKKPEK